MTVIYNSLHELEWIMRMNRAEAKLLPSCPEFAILFVGRLVPEKGVELLLRAMVFLKGCGVRLDLVGGGPLERELRILCSELGLENVYFHGPCYDETKVAEYFRSTNVFVSPGNVGLNCIHALTYGRPVVTHDDPVWQMPEWEALRAGVNAEFFKRGDARALADAIIRVKNAKNSGGYSPAQCREVVLERYNPQSQADLISSFLLGLLCENYCIV